MDIKGFIAIAILVSSLLAIGCAGAQGDQKYIGINVDRQKYTPLMSSTVGIGLTPVFGSDVDNSTVSFRWHTDYGYFLAWGAPDFKVGNLGQDVTAGDGKLYWSYDPNEMDKVKPPVHVTLTMVDKRSGRTINSTGMEIGWEDKGMAVVKSS